MWRVVLCAVCGSRLAPRDHISVCKCASVRLVVPCVERTRHARTFDVQYRITKDNPVSGLGDRGLVDLSEDHPDLGTHVALAPVYDLDPCVCPDHPLCAPSAMATWKSS